MVVTASEDKSIIVWKPRTGEVAKKISGILNYQYIRC